MLPERRKPARWRITRGVDPSLDAFLAGMWIIIALCLVAVVFMDVLR